MQQFDIVVINLKHLKRGAAVGSDYDDVEYHFSQAGAPPVAGFHPRGVIDSLTETTAEIKPTEGLGSRGSFSLTMADSTSDPYAIDGSRVATTGTFFSMLLAKNTRIGDTSSGGANPHNKKVTVHTFRTDDDGVTSEYSRREYLIESVTCNGATWTIKGNDTLAKINEKKQQYPRVIDSKTGDWNIGVDDGVFTIKYGNAVLEAQKITDTDWIMIGGEVMQVTGVNEQSITVKRHSTITINKQVMSNEIEDHEADDEVQIVKYFDNVLIADYLKDVLIVSGMKPKNLAYDDWVSELDTYHNTSRVNGLLTEPRDVSKVIKEICEQYQIDIWLDNEVLDKPEPLVRMTVTSAWLESTKSIHEGVDYLANSLRIKPLEDKRYSRAAINFSPRIATGASDLGDFKRGEFWVNETLETPEEYDGIKLLQFDSSLLLGKSEAELTVKRYIDRFADTANVYTIDAPEHKVDYVIGDVLNLYNPVITDGYGNLVAARAQVLGIKPDRADVRIQKVKLMTYVPAIDLSPDNDPADPTTYAVQNIGSDTDLFLANVYEPPSKAVGLRFLIGANGKADIGASNTSNAAIDCAGFPAGSVIELVLLNGSIVQSAGGDGNNALILNDDFISISESGGALLSNVPVEVTVKVFLSGTYAQSGTTPDNDFSYSCDGGFHAGGGGGATGVYGSYIFSSGGGAGRVAGTTPKGNTADGVDGSVNGLGGAGHEQVVYGNPTRTIIAGYGGDWGKKGQDGFSRAGTFDFTTYGGKAGKVVDNVLGTVEIYGSNIETIPDNGSVSERFHRGSASLNDFTLINL